MTGSRARRVERHLVVGLGELVWDHFPRGARLGGAPANVAYHAAALGDHGVVASRVGDDAPGRAAADQLERHGVDTSALQVDPDRPTGTVEVALDQGEPRFAIDAAGAWTGCAWTPAWEALLRHARVVCYGSLLQAFPTGRALLRRARAAAPHATWLLDLNLRPPFDSPQAIDAALAAATALKLSEQELATLADHLGQAPDHLCRWLVQTRGLDAVAVTRGARGAALITPDSSAEHPGHPAAGGDAVGAGDAFTAALAHHLLRGSPAARALDAANHYAAHVASCEGAMPAAPQTVLERVRAGVTTKR